MEPRAAVTDLDVVVLGGGGHVGLPLSLVLARAGLTVGIFDTNEATVERIRAGQMPFMETGAEDLLARAPADRPARAELRPDDDRALAVDRRRHRDADGRVPRSVDDRLREGGRPDRAASPRRRAGGPAEHGLSRHHRVRRPASRRARLPRPTSCSARSGSPRATRSRSSAACPRSSAPTPTGQPRGPRPCSGGSSSSGSARRTREAELAKLLTNTWRYMKFAVANQFFMISHQAGVDYTNVLRAIREDYPRAAGPARSGLRRRPVPVQGHDAAGRLHRRPLPARPVRDAGQRGPARVSSSRPSSGATARSTGGPSASSAWRSRPSRTTPARRSAYKLRKLLAWAGARVLCTDPYVVDERLVSTRRGRRRERRHRPRASRTRRIAGSRFGSARDVVDIWGALGAGIRLVKILVTGAAGFICGYLVPELLERGHEVVGIDDFSKYGRLAKSYDQHPGYRFVEGDAKDAGLLTELAADCDQVVAAAAMIGGISYFHEFAYDLIAENERILAVDLRRGHRRAPIAGTSSGSWSSARRWSTSRRPSSRPPRAPSSPARRRCRPTASRSSPASTSPAGRPSSTSCRTRSSDRSTASASASGGRSATATS